MQNFKGLNMNKTKLTDFDITQYLDNKETIAEYLSQVLEDKDMDELLEALGNIAKAKGMSQISSETGLGRESLYKTFQKGTKPRFDTIMKVIESFGVKIKISA
ncbi:MAG: putative addiction module antidote protein [Sulfurospirillaceae bacterium]|nr:putative addiction module antidote protein [Sulfurospirillaceae bacterium]